MGQASSVVLSQCMSQERAAKPAQLPTLLGGRGELTMSGKVPQKPRHVDEQEIMVKEDRAATDRELEEEMDASLAAAVAGFAAPPEPQLEEEPSFVPAEEGLVFKPAAGQALPPIDTLPRTLQHGAREKRHLAHLGIIRSDRAGEERAHAASEWEQLQGMNVDASLQAVAPEEVQPQGPAAAAAAGREGHDAGDGAAGHAASGESEAKRERKRRSRSKALRKRAKADVQPFLAKHGFNTVKGPRRWLFRTSYPLHQAVRERDAVIVRQLLIARANPSKVDSAGRTPLDLAEEKNRYSSHCDVIALLTQPRSSMASSRSGGILCGAGPKRSEV